MNLLRKKHQEKHPLAIPLQHNVKTIKEVEGGYQMCDLQFQHALYPSPKDILHRIENVLHFHSRFIILSMK